MMIIGSPSVETVFSVPFDPVSAKWKHRHRDLEGAGWFWPDAALPIDQQCFDIVDLWASHAVFAAISFFLVRAADREAKKIELEAMEG